MVIQPPGPEKEQVESSHQTRQQTEPPSPKQRDQQNEGQRNSDIQPGEGDGISKPARQVRYFGEQGMGEPWFDNPSGKGAGPRQYESEGCQGWQEPCQVGCLQVPDFLKNCYFPLDHGKTHLLGFARQFNDLLPTSPSTSNK